MGMITSSVTRLRAELTSALENIRAKENEVDQLQGRIEELSETLNQRQRQHDVELKRRDDQVRDLSRVFERKDVTSMTRPQLLSLIQEGINEARRKGMVEAEGLLSRHKDLERETDLELMRGVVRQYEARIVAVEADRAARETPIKLDTRPFNDKLDAVGTRRARAVEFKAPTWWDLPGQVVSSPEPAPAKAAPSDFKTFDKTAEEVRFANRAKSFVVGSRVTVPGSIGGTYILERSAEHTYSCTCPAWKFARVHVEQRTCKHLETYLGTASEAVRVTKAAERNKGTTSCFCGQPLVRGQCPQHTRDWKGDEACRCGRKFAACKAAYDTLSIVQRNKGHQPELATQAQAGAIAAANYNGIRW